jgi:hypothetical protein
MPSLPKRTAWETTSSPARLELRQNVRVREDLRAQPDEPPVQAVGPKAGGPKSRLDRARIAVQDSGRLSAAPDPVCLTFCAPRPDVINRADAGLASVDRFLPARPVALAELVLLELPGRGALQRLAKLDACGSLEVR